MRYLITALALLVLVASADARLFGRRGGNGGGCGGNSGGNAGYGGGCGTQAMMPVQYQIVPMQAVPCQPRAVPQAPACKECAQAPAVVQPLPAAAPVQATYYYTYTQPVYSQPMMFSGGNCANGQCGVSGRRR